MLGCVSVQSKMAVVIFSLTFIVLLPCLCFYLSLYQSFYYKIYFRYLHSMYPDEDNRMFKKLVHENEVRVKNAEEVLLENSGVHLCSKGVESSDKNEDLGEDEKLKHYQRKVDIAVTVITSSRDIYWNDKLYFAPRYILQNIAKFMTLLKTDREFSYCVSVCSVDTTPSNDTVKVSPRVQVFHRPVDNTAIDPTETVWNLRQTKEKADYAFCMGETLHRVQSDYLLMLEDDTLPKDDILNVVEYTITHYNSGDYQAGHPWLPSLSNIAYFKLYHPSRVEGYIGLEPEKLLSLFAFAALTGTLTFVSMVIITHRNSVTMTTTWLLCMVYWLLVGLCVGRPHLEQLRQFSPFLYSVLPDALCCSQALLIPLPAARGLLEHLSTPALHQGLAKDTAIEQFARWKGGARLVQPNLFEHIGLVSAVQGGVIDPHLLLE